MKKGRHFSCVFKETGITVGVLKDGTEICLLKIICGCENWGCSYAKTFHNLRIEQMEEIGITELADIFYSHNDEEKKEVLK